MNSNDFKQITANVFFKTENDTMIFYDDSFSRLGQVTRILDEDNRVLKYLDFKKESEAFSTDSLHDILIQFIESSNLIQVKELVIENFPLDINTFDQISDAFLKFYPKAITISYDKNTSIDIIHNIRVYFKNPRITHYVQQAYLRNFSSNEKVWKKNRKKDKARIFCFDKKICSVITVGNTKIEREQGVKITRIAYREYYYSLYLEEFMRHTLERIIPPLLENIILSRSLKNVSNELKYVLSQYIILSWLRTVEAREYMRESLEKSILEVAIIELGSHAVEGLRVKIDETKLRMSHENQIMKFLFPEEDPNLSDRLKKFQWGLIKARRPDFFLTSDTPVVFHNSYIEKQIKLKGRKFFEQQEKEERDFIESKNPSAYFKLTSPNKYKRPGVEGIEIYLPISPNLCLYMVDKKLGFKSLDVKKINKLIIIQSERFIFSRYNKFDFVKKIINKYPECIDKTGKRTIIESTILDEIGNKNKRFARFEAVKPPYK